MARWLRMAMASNVSPSSASSRPTAPTTGRTQAGATADDFVRGCAITGTGVKPAIVAHPATITRTRAVAALLEAGFLKREPDIGPH